MGIISFLRSLLSSSVAATNLLTKIPKSALLESSIENIKEWYECGNSQAIVHEAIGELVEAGEFNELNDRFFKTLTFGTGGIRGRTISGYITKAEIGNGSKILPEFPAIGSACLNHFNVIRATIALHEYCKKVAVSQGREMLLVVAYDVRFFSKLFAEITAKTWEYLGGKAMIFDGPRSTPQLSFSVRYFRAMAGVVITASHNPYYDNGYKAYFADGAQVIDPQAAAIIENFSKLKLADSMAIFKAIEAKEFTNTVSGKDEERYVQVVKDSVLDRASLKNCAKKVVFTPLHGTGGVVAVPALQSLGVEVICVEEQMKQDPGFSTVKSPNPENFDSLKLAIDRAKATGADLVIATDPDADRMAIAAKNNDGEFEKFSGNLTASLLLEYRIRKMKELGILPKDGSKNAVVLKTFVTTPLVEKIAISHGLKCVNTLTGFKWIGSKINNYALGLMEKVGNVHDGYDDIELDERRKLLLQHSQFCIFGCEESYGCLASDLVRDKDANAAAAMVCEMLAELDKKSITLMDFRMEIYSTYGYYDDTLLNIYYEGASGVARIKNILSSYRKNPPETVAGQKVLKIQDFLNDPILDADGCHVPREDFLFLELENGDTYAVRGSGTEPKIKFYIFCHGEGAGYGTEIDVVGKIKSRLDALKGFLEADAEVRSAG
ncbi:MAG: phospho-sugar mutase [Puniceicoccales bacterium]|jgi:phosphoglucomutase|nr:phospho-sugar mutase [Puniceicoccales bacterium]